MKVRFASSVVLLVGALGAGCAGQSPPEAELERPVKVWLDAEEQDLELIEIEHKDYNPNLRLSDGVRRRCKSPCGEVFEGASHQKYYLGGSPLETSGPFTIPVPGKEVTIYVERGDPTASFLGWMAAWAGGSAAIAGGVVTGFGLDADSKAAAGVGVSITVASLAGMIAGLIVWSNNAPALEFQQGRPDFSYD